MPYGRQGLLGQVGYDIQLSSDGKPIVKQGGVTLDWTTVTAVSGTDVTLNDGTVVKIGNSYLRYGQVICRITAKPVQVLTVTGTPTGGTFIVSGTRPDTGVSWQTAAIAYNASAAAMLAALRLVVGTANVASVTFGSAAWTVTFNIAIPQVTVDSSLLTGGTTPAVTPTTTTAGLSVGKFGPYDSAASDGRQTLTRGECYLLNYTALQNVALGIGPGANDNPMAIEGGTVWKDRLIATAGTHSLAAGPTFTELEAAFPRLAYTQS